MENVTQILATTHEISLKGGNRRWFERKLTESIRRALADLRPARIERPAWRVLITFPEPVPFTEAARRLGTVFGLNSFMPAEHAGFTLDDLRAHLEKRLPQVTAETFAVRCARSDKSFPKTSVDIEREIGTFVQERTGWPVDLTRPALTLHLLVDETGISCWWRRVAGPGGLPTGTGGRAACMLSGGIDSPVAAYLMMKRGMRLDLIHFHSVPRTDPASLKKVEDMVRILGRYQGPARLAMVPLLPIQEQIVARCPAEHRVLLYRRFMLRIGERLARRFKSRALITGESLGQVASQTIENLAAVEAVTNLPVMRPCIGLDKQQIIAIARRTGTYETSILPHFDCCSFHAPDHPETRARAADLATLESVLPVDELVAEAIAAAEVTRITDFADWTTIPSPVRS